MTQKAFQDYYPDGFSHCYGCGRLNDKGLKIKSYWDGEQSVARFTPENHHIAIPGFVYGGLIASLIDCHCVGTAAAASCRNQGIDIGRQPGLRFVTASLKVDYLAPTPLGTELEVRATVLEVKEKKVVVEAKVMAGTLLCATGHVVAVRLPGNMIL
ncbi:MAG: PaaI family thioesterase [Proteobacteria bacterium]|nr:PaaI family thioesterase [Pseudomonadota bacterium]MBU1389083.1 PaaI family thioesterase [Pseudomonadota bacterium]MBU1543636.1 PaaI family thioesterase [Pseudomonadota bacterium]MBU2479840.1 PaaI family thioesterase [Pseudomonadota bacterium]